MNEKPLEKKLREGVKKARGLALKLSCFFFTGLPDRLILWPPGRAGFAEVKTTGKKPSPRQDVVIAQLRKMGFPVWIVDSEETLAELINDISK